MPSPATGAPAPLGIDHPLLAVRDLDAAARSYRRLGFRLAPRSHHSWGTSNHLVMFQHDFIELIGIGNPERVDMPVNEEGFAFGRVIADVLARREGIAMLALHSENGRQDYRDAVARGVPARGVVDFRRAVDLGDGSTGEAVVTLGLFWNPAAPKLSTFLCHQHRPELIWVPAWQQHPNGVAGITRVSYTARDPAALRPYLAALWGASNILEAPDGLEVRTPNGRVEIIALPRLARRFAGVAVPPPAAPDLPCGIAVGLHAPALDRVASALRLGQVPFAETHAPDGQRVLRVAASEAAGTVLEFSESVPLRGA